MDPVDTIARVSQLLLSRRISANLALGVLLAVGLSLAGHLLWPQTLTELRALGTPVVVLTIVILLAFGYGLANLIIDFGRFVANQHRATKERRRADAEAREKLERQEALRSERVARMSNLIPHLTESQLRLLKFLSDEVDPPEIAWNQFEFYHEFSHLISNGFLCVVERDLPEKKELYRLTSEGAEAIQAYRQAIVEQDTRGDEAEADSEG